MQKVIFFPGFAEDARAFDAMLPFFEDWEVTFANYHPLLTEVSIGGANMHDFARKLIETYQIEPDTLLVGHSFGGWTVANIQHFNGNPCVLIGGFTDPERVRRNAFGFSGLGYFAVRAGIFKSSPFRLGSRLLYGGTKTWKAVEPCLDVMQNWTNEELLKIVALINGQPPIHATGAMLRIHGQNDEVIKPPRMPHIRIEGNHFIQHTDAAFIAQTIKNWDRAHS